MTDTMERSRLLDDLKFSGCWPDDLGTECPQDWEMFQIALIGIEAGDIMEGSIDVKATLDRADLAIIDTRTHRPVRVHTFDKDDPETWPKTELAPSGKPWLVCARVGWKSFFWHPVCGMEFDMEWFALGVTAYYDPADLTGGA